MDFDSSNNEEDFDPKIYIRKTTLLPATLMQIKCAIDKFEKEYQCVFNWSWKRLNQPNLSKEEVALLQKVKTDRDFIIVGTDKNLGPSIIVRDTYMRSLKDHLDYNSIYLELNYGEARLFNNHNF